MPVKSKSCPRCRGDIVPKYDGDSSCIQCGYQVYSSDNSSREEEQSDPFVMGIRLLRNANGLNRTSMIRSSGYLGGEMVRECIGILVSHGLIVSRNRIYRRTEKGADLMRIYQGVPSEIRSSGALLTLRKLGDPSYNSGLEGAAGLESTRALRLYGYMGDSGLTGKGQRLFERCKLLFDMASYLPSVKPPRQLLGRTLL